MKKSACAFVLALLAAAAFISCSDGSGSGSGSDSQDASLGADGIVTDGRKMVTATPQSDGIHFSIEIPAIYARLGGVGISIFRDIEIGNGETVSLEAGVFDKKNTSDIVYPLVKEGETYTFSISMEPEDKSDIDWRKKYIYSEQVTVTAEGGLGDITVLSGLRKPEVTEWLEWEWVSSSETRHPRVEFHVKDSDLKFSLPQGVSNGKSVEEDGNEGFAAVCVGDPDHWDSYTQWLGWSYASRDQEKGEGRIVLWDGNLENYNRYLSEVYRQTGKKTVMIQRRWELDVPDAKNLSWRITIMGNPQDIKDLKKLDFYTVAENRSPEQ